MDGLTLKELIILIILIAAVVAIVVGLAKGAVKVAICIAICVFLFSGFTWLPNKIKEWTGSTQEPDDINETIDLVKDEASDLFNVDVNKIDEGIESGKKAVNTVKDFAKEEGPSWLASLKSLWAKISGTNENTVE